MTIKELNRPILDRLRKELDAQLSNTTIEGVSIALGSCSYDSGQATFKLEVKVNGVETREQKALKMYAQLDGLDLDKEHPRYKLVEFHAKKRQYPYIYIDKTKPNLRFKGSTDWAIRHFGKDGSWQKEMSNG
tara:strand:- start:202 stop:597 length:396 start_codon:yes stop_codon:yes gene_type:complete